MDSNCLKVEIDRNIYDESVVTKTLYWFSGDYQIERHLLGSLELICFNGSDCINQRKLKSDFLQKLNDYKLRQVIEKETGDIRTVLYIKAFSNSDVFDEK